MRARSAPMQHALRLRPLDRLARSCRARDRSSRCSSAARATRTSARAGERLGERASRSRDPRRAARGGARRACRPPAARMPLWRMPPPYILRSRWHFLMKSRAPAITEPAGAPRPFDRHTLTESKPAASSRSLAPVATAAFQIRAPSRCVVMPSACAACGDLGEPRAVPARCRPSRCACSRRRRRASRAWYGSSALNARADVGGGEHAAFADHLGLRSRRARRARPTRSASSARRRR